MIDSDNDKAERAIGTVRRCIDNGGVAVYPDWLHEQAMTVRQVRDIIEEVLQCPTALRVKEIRNAIDDYLRNRLQTLERQLVSAASEPAIRNALQVEVPDVG